MSEPTMAETGLYARIRVRPTPDCILRQLSEAHHVQQYLPGIPGGSQPRVVVGVTTDTAAESLNAAAVDELIWLGDRAVCLLRNPDTPPPAASTTDESSEKDATKPDCDMLLYGFGTLPVAPIAIRLADGWVELHLVTTAYSKLRDTVSALREATFDVDLRQVVRSDRASGSMFDEQSRLSTVDLSVLTARQRAVATTAIEMGYFEQAGATADETAAALDISKSTLSEHLRIVIRKLLSQLVP